MDITRHLPRSGRARALASGIGAAAVGAAVAVGGSALSASANQAAPAVTPKCATSDLRVWLGVPGSSATGHTAYQLELSNISGHACTLEGYPGVSAVRSGGDQLGSAAARDSSDPTRLVTLVRGATAHVFLLTTNVAFFSSSACHPTTAFGLKVYPPNETTAQVVPFSLGACAKAGPVFLRVRAVVAGTGIPGFSN
jgi:hypothetical protein